MKKTKRISYKLMIIFLLPLLGLAQSKRETLETFDVETNPVITLDVSHAEVVVTTWNKNKVEVKTTLSSETFGEKEASELFDVHEVKVLGNSNRVEVSSANNPGVRNFTFIQSPKPPKSPKPNMSSPRPPMPPGPALEFDFDYLAFKEEGKAYLEKFKQQLNSTDFKDEMNNFRKEMMVWKDQFLKDSLMSFHSDLDSLKIYIKTFRDVAQDMFQDLKEDYGNSISESSVKKVIEIKVPQSARFEVDLRHSKLDADAMKDLTANLRYSDFKLKDLSGKNSEINMKYSTLRVDSADQLSLNLVYSKKVELGDVNKLNVRSKMSELSIKHLKDQGLINGSYGKLFIDKIDPDFFLIDIQLEKSTANLKLPKNTSYRFYAKSSNSKFNMNTDLDLKMSKSFEDVIYTSAGQTNDAQILSLSANYSTINLD
ncbi:hypothetical protein [Psychroflexus sediminis]|uniref:Adhesin domain-containing protein n=1 Tax=Psychroflexus sediminis TaxID=470826 RepID=A0A1G7WT84_9FLAO|nr:hypothetical protein [Psychroflexus sediminis]SDG75141.1 hypothetical protein SAMN04488027_106114 [Psychroflexus sediminis]